MGVVQNTIDIKELNAEVKKTASDVTELSERVAKSVTWNDIVGYVGKNILPNKMTTGTAQDVTFTVNDDGTVSLSGTAAANVDRAVYDTRDYGVLWKDQTVILSKGTNNNNVTMYVNAYNGTAFVKTIKHLNSGTETAPFKLDYDGYDRVRITIYVAANTDTTGIKVEPMFRVAGDSDSTYAPYLISNNLLVPIATLKSVTASSADFAAFKTAIAAL